MSELTNRASYLQGLAEGLKLDTDKTEGKLIGELLNLVSDMAKELESLDDEQAFVADKLDEMEDVIDVIGENVFGEDDDDDDVVYTANGQNYVTDEDEVLSSGYGIDPDSTDGDVSALEKIIGLGDDNEDAAAGDVDDDDFTFDGDDEDEDEEQ